MGRTPPAHALARRAASGDRGIRGTLSRMPARFEQAFLRASGSVCGIASTAFQSSCRTLQISLMQGEILIAAATMTELGGSPRGSKFFGKAQPSAQLSAGRNARSLTLHGSNSVGGPTGRNANCVPEKIFLTNDIDKNQSRLWSNIRYEWPNTGDLPRNRARFPSNPNSPRPGQGLLARTEPGRADSSKGTRLPGGELAREGFTRAMERLIAANAVVGATPIANVGP